MFQITNLKLLFICGLTSFASLYSQSIIASTLSPVFDIQQPSSSVTLRKGISFSNFSWGISQSSLDNRPLSQLSYQDIETDTTSVEMNISKLLGFKPNYWDISTQMSYGKVQSGTLVDNDYSYSASGQSLSTQTTASLKGSINYGLEIGANRSLSSSRISHLDVLLGFTLIRDNYKQTNGFQTYSQERLLSSPVEIEGLNSSYEALWLGPYIGLAQHYNLGQNKFTFSSKLRGHVYSGEGRWNLREEFAQPKSFEHSAYGAGVEVKANHVLNLTSSMRIEQHVGFDHSRTLNGKDTVFYADGNSIETNLLPAEKNNFFYNIGFTWLM